MKLIEKDKPDADPVHLPWDAAQAALASGAYDHHRIEGERGPDQPGAQAPAPGVVPKDGPIPGSEDQMLPNLTPVSVSAQVNEGLPKEAPPPPPAKPAPAVKPEAKPADK